MIQAKISKKYNKKKYSSFFVFWCLAFRSSFLILGLAKNVYFGTPLTERGLGGEGKSIQMEPENRGKRQGKCSRTSGQEREQAVLSSDNAAGRTRLRLSD